ncbi:TolC family protein [Geothrix sp. PMB-07]|uniref:TolC family protein n=1 Tax=Geothrix sp. PMB-07 TaxID=3068640 RepID=UPI0027421E9E|nr:TolC family protein [Geothrix sp. PMB-07]WLT30510.1 TolC family protein [Geothrix sp. PMB-07]
MSRPSRLWPALVLLAPGLAQVPPTESPSADPVLSALLREALDSHPDLQKAAAAVRMDQERVPQAGVLPDPSLSLGLQNDGFKRLEVGRMETSFYSVAFTQPFPWPGKRGLRKEVAAIGVEVSEAARSRVRLGLEADVRRGYTNLLLIRGQKALQAEQRTFLEQAEQLARTRYEVGQGSQGDLLRAQLERTRLQVATWALEAEEKSAVAGLNRLRQHEPADSIDTSASLADLPEPDLLGPEAVEAISPELAGARATVRQTERQLDLAKLDRRPDFAVTAGLMPRGSLDPMWQVGVSMSLPIYGRHKQQRAVAEHEHHRQGQGAEVDSVRSLLRQRTEERSLQIQALRRTRELYRQGLLVQSEASFKSALAQYEAGRAPFLSTLDALNGWVSDQGAFLQTLAQLQAQHIALREAALGATASVAGGSLGSAAMGSGASAAPTTSARTPGAAAGGAQDAGPAMTKM